MDENLDVSFSGRVSLHLETALAADRFARSSRVRRGFSGGARARCFTAGSLQSNARNDTRARSRIRSAGAGAHAASSHSYLFMDSDRARCRHVVYSRIALLPYSGKLWPLSESYRSNPTDFEVTLGL